MGVKGRSLKLIPSVDHLARAPIIQAKREIRASPLAEHVPSTRMARSLTLAAASDSVAPVIHDAWIMAVVLPRLRDCESDIAIKSDAGDGSRCFVAGALRF